MKRCIDDKELRTIVPYSRTHRRRLTYDPKYMGDDPFPDPVRISKCRLCWWLHEVLEWLERRSAKRSAKCLNAPE